MCSEKDIDRLLFPSTSSDSERKLCLKLGKRQGRRVRVAKEKNIGVESGTWLGRRRSDEGGRLLLLKINHGDKIKSNQSGTEESKQPINQAKPNRTQKTIHNLTDSSKGQSIDWQNSREIRPS